jgi:ketosteroid isomerase-like protein
VIDSPFITWNAPDGDHPARTMQQRSFDAVGRGAKEEWLDLYSDDAVVEDPVGPSPFDPEGKGHRGRDGVSAFWDLTIAPIARFRFVVHDSFANGDTCASVASITTTMADGTEATTDLVTIHTIDADGRIKQMRAHWEFERTIASLRSPSAG